MKAGAASLKSDERFAYANNPPSLPPYVAKATARNPISLDFHQAFVTSGNHKEFPFSLKVGRQELSYGEERLVGAFGWNNIGRVFDAAKVRWQNEWFGADFFTSRVVIPEDDRFNVDNDYDWFSGIYATTEKFRSTLLDVYVLARNASARKPLPPSRARSLPSPAPAIFTPSACRLQVQARRVRQLGLHLSNRPTSSAISRTAAWARHARLEHEAYMVVAQGGYTFSDAWATPRLGVRICLRLRRQQSKRREARDIRKSLSHQPQVLRLHGFRFAAKHP